MAHGREIAAFLGCIFLVSACVILIELEVFVTDNYPGRRTVTKRIRAERPDGGEFFKINPYVHLPNEGRKEALALSKDVGIQSVYNGLHQKERQRWLQEEERRLLEMLNNESPPSAGDDRRNLCRGRGPEIEVDGPERGRRLDLSRDPWSTMSARVGEMEEAGAVVGAERKLGLAKADQVCEEYLKRLRVGVGLWNETYVPPIAPKEKQRLVAKWAGAGNETGSSGLQNGARRILFVISSFDRGRRLRAGGYNGDKFDFILMILDEVREACEAGFSPHVHLIAAWDAIPELAVIQERLFCRRVGEAVPFTFKEYPRKLQELLSIKHRIYMKSRLDDFDVFIQAEDDMIVTVNHILLYLEELEKLTHRRGEHKSLDFRFSPGFIRVEHGSGEDVEAAGYGGELYEWEVILSRIEGIQIPGAGVYLTLGPSRILRYGGNNQGFWMATQGQLRHMNTSCGYLDYTEKSSIRHVEWFSGSLEMFSKKCQVSKVFPANRFEDFLVHHRTDNKNGRRGETIPAASVTMMRLWISQILRDAVMLQEAN